MSYRPVSEELKANIAEDLAVGCTFSDIAGRYGVSFSTIRRIKNAIPTAAPLNEQKKSPEAPTAMDNASEDITDSGSAADTNIIPDVPEVVKPAESYDTALLNPTVCGAVLDRINKTDEELAALRRDITLLENEKKALEDYLRKYKEVQSNGTR